MDSTVELSSEAKLAISIELLELTGLSPEKLAAYMKSLKAENYVMCDTAIDTAVRRYYAKNGRELPDSKLKELELKKYEGHLRIRFIDIPLEYNKDDEDRLRFLCGYEVQTDYFYYEMITSENYKKGLTEIDLMNYVEKIQTKIQIPIASVFLTQKLIDSHKDKLYWNWITSSLVDEVSDSLFEARQIVKIKQSLERGLVSEISLKNKEEKSDVIEILNKVERRCHSFIRKNLKEKQDAAKDHFAYLIGDIKREREKPVSPFTHIYKPKVSLEPTKILVPILKKKPDFFTPSLAVRMMQPTMGEIEILKNKKIKSDNVFYESVKNLRIDRQSEINTLWRVGFQVGFYDDTHWQYRFYKLKQNNFDMQRISMLIPQPQMYRSACGWWKIVVPKSDVSRPYFLNSA
jgi:hypothetical protein